MVLSSAVSSPGLPRRRNGKQRACEPCRKAKIACDHSLPTCQRCRRKNISSKCCYLDAPMTKRPLQDDSVEASPGLPPTPVQRSLTSPDITSPPLTASDAALERSPELDGSTPTTNRPVGFFGPTAFSAVFSENRENFETDFQMVSSTIEPSGTSYESILSQTCLMLGGYGHQRSARVLLGAKVFRQLPDERSYHFLMNYYYETMHEWLFNRHTILHCSDSLWSTFAKELVEPRRLTKLEEASTILCKNAETALEEYDDYEKYLHSFSGLNFRWEILGQIFITLASALLSIPDRDPFFTTQKGSRSNRKHFAIEMKDAAQACITLSNYTDLLNVQMVALLTKNMILSTVIHGDTSLLAWRQLGDLVSTATALGLHRDADVDRPISVISEFRCRLFGAIFNMDKGTSQLTGRPPALSYQYTRFRPAMAVSDVALMRGGEELEKAIASLDSNGWNTDGYIYPNTMNRAYHYLSIISDEILQLSLGDDANVTKERCRQLIDKLNDTWASFPSFIRLSKTDMTLQGQPGWVVFRKLMICLSYLERRLILERLAEKTGDNNWQTLIDCARELLELTVFVWVQRDKFVEYHHDFDWMLMCYGVPAAGVLCIQLLNQMRNSAQAREQQVVFPRSEVVQNLSLLIGFLDWVQPTAGNYQLCTRMRRTIKQILDKVLNPPLMQQPISVGLPVSEVSVNTGEVDFDPDAFSGNGLDDFDWLNSVDWSRGPWIDLGGLS